MTTEGYTEINPPLFKNTGNISRESCKSGKQTSAHARVCLQDLQVSREIFPVFLTKGRLIYLLYTKIINGRLRECHNKIT